MSRTSCAATAGGGIWKAVNGGKTWDPIFDDGLVHVSRDGGGRGGGAPQAVLARAAAALERVRAALELLRTDGQD